MANVKMKDTEGILNWERIVSRWKADYSANGGDWNQAKVFLGDPKPTKAPRGGYRPAPVVRRPVRPPVFVVGNAVPTPARRVRITSADLGWLRQHVSVALRVTANPGPLPLVRRVRVPKARRVRITSADLRNLRGLEVARRNMVRWFAAADMLFDADIRLATERERLGRRGNRALPSPFRVFGPHLREHMGQAFLAEPNSSDLNRQVTEEAQLPLLQLLAARNLWYLPVEEQRNIYAGCNVYCGGFALNNEVASEQASKREWIAAKTATLLAVKEGVPAEVAEKVALRAWERTQKKSVLCEVSLHRIILRSAKRFFEKGVPDPKTGQATYLCGPGEAVQRAEEVACEVLRRAWSIAVGDNVRVGRWKMPKDGSRLAKMFASMGKMTEQQGMAKILRYVRSLVPTACRDDLRRTRSINMPKGGKQAGGVWGGYRVGGTRYQAAGDSAEGSCEDVLANPGAGEDPEQEAYITLLMERLDEEQLTWLVMTLDGYSKVEIKRLRKWSQSKEERIRQNVCEKLDDLLGEDLMTEVKQAKELREKRAKVVSQREVESSLRKKEQAVEERKAAEKAARTISELQAAKVAKANAQREARRERDRKLYAAKKEAEGQAVRSYSKK